MKTKIFLFLTILLSLNMGFAQTPKNDPNWMLHFEDNFDAAPLNLNKWDYRPTWKSTCLPSGTVTDPYNGGTNHLFSNGKLKLISKEEQSICESYSWEEQLDENGNPMFDENGYPLYIEYVDLKTKLYTSGQIISKTDFKYGYFEIYCKIPQYSDSRHGRGLSPTFWLWPQDNNHYKNSNVLWSEIDIFEIDAENNKYTFNVHYKDSINDNGLASKPTWSLYEEELVDLTYYKPITFDTFHKFGCEWTPKYISFYVDDILRYTTEVKHFYNNDLYQYTDKLLPMNFWIGIATHADNFQKEITSYTEFPYEFEIDYVRVYKLNMDCDNDFYSSYGYSNFDNSVKRSIFLNHSIPLGGNYSFRATQDIILSDGFDVPIGSSIYINNSDCE